MAGDSVQDGGLLFFGMQDAHGVCRVQVVDGLMHYGRTGFKSHKFEPSAEEMFATPAKTIRNAASGRPSRPVFFGLTAIDVRAMSQVDIAILETERRTSIEWATLLQDVARRFEDETGSRSVSEGNAKGLEEDDESASFGLSVVLGD